jgi:hypothetical protein
MMCDSREVSVVFVCIRLFPFGGQKDSEVESLFGRECRAKGWGTMA